MAEDIKYYGFIYITTNNINGKKYIGQKCYSQKNWKTYLGSGIILKKAIKKHGRENFSREIIEECESKEQLDQREKYWIEYYDAIHNPEYYNIATGGDGGNTIAGYSKEKLEEYKKQKSELHKQTSLKGENAPQAKLTNKEVYEIIKELLKDGFSSDIAKKYNVSNRTIDDIRNHLTWCELTKDIEFPIITNRKRPGNVKPIYQYTENGTFIAEFANARIAEQETGTPYKQISQVCNGQKRSAHGYIWRFKGDSFDKYEIENPRLIKVDQYDKEGNYIATYNSIIEAEAATNSHSIGPVLKGRIKSSGGFYWVIHGQSFIMPKYERKRIS